MIYAIYALIALGFFFALAGVVGMLRMPDALCRMQSSTNIATFGVLGVILAAVLYSIWQLQDPAMTVKLAVLGIFYIVTNPISSHAIAKAAYSRKLPLTEMVCDQLKEDLEDEN